MALTPEQIASATGCKPENVATVWPWVVVALQEQGIDTPLIQIAAAATIATETPSFLPVAEKLANPNKQPGLAALQSRYMPYIGRGLVQITWKANYEAAGKALGIDLVHSPALACEVKTAARILAWFFKTRRLEGPCEAQDWVKVRRIVNGGTNGLERFQACVKALQSLVA